MEARVKRVSRAKANQVARGECHVIDDSIPTAFSIYEKLSEFVIGQDRAKKAISLAIVNNQRRIKLEKINKELASSIIPKNVLLSGPTGSGKTEIGRKVAEICDAPFLKTEVTKFTEVGYAGKDVESIIADLFFNAIKDERKKQTQMIEERVRSETFLKIAKLIVKQYSDLYKDTDISLLVEKIKDNKFKDLEIEIDNHPERIVEILDPGIEDTRNAGFNIIPIFGSIDFTSSKKKKKVSIQEAFKILERKEIQKNINEEDIVNKAKEKVENRGIIFLDEIDKIITNKEYSGRGEVSREGVQRDLLSIIEGTTVMTPYGPIDTDHILFIASGAFHSAVPDDLMDEMRGRFPIRATLEALTTDDYYKILTKKKFNLIQQYEGLLSCSSIKIVFDDEAIHEIASATEKLNINLGNLGARRLFSIMEIISEEISFEKKPKKDYKITKEFVQKISEKLHSDSVDLVKFVI